jgi:hypothetical protein
VLVRGSILGVGAARVYRRRRLLRIVVLVGVSTCCTFVRDQISKELEHARSPSATHKSICTQDFVFARRFTFGVSHPPGGR